MRGGKLTAEILAQAIVAAARAYGDDPVRALTAARGLPRRSLTAAGEGAAIAVGQPYSVVARVLGLRGGNIARSKHHPSFAAALAAAEIAARAQLVRETSTEEPAGWPDPALPAQEARPPAAASIVRPRVLAAGAVRREVLFHLALDPATAPDLAETLMVGEAQVRQALADLRETGAVVADPLTQEGWRVQFWRRVSR
jgi:hypothetical protein